MKIWKKFIKNNDILNNDDKFIYIYRKNNKFKNSSKIAFPPKRNKILKNNNDKTKEDITNNNIKNDNTIISSTNNDKNDNISFNEKYNFEEIYDDDDGDFSYNNYMQNKNDYQRNNYLNYKRRDQILMKIKHAFFSIKDSKMYFLDDYNPYNKNKKKSFISEPIDVYKDRLNNFLSDFDTNIKINRFNTYPKYNNLYDKSNKNDTSKNSKFLHFLEEESVIGNERFFQPSNSNKSKDRKFEENKNSEILILKNRRRSNDLITDSGEESLDIMKIKKKNNLIDKNRLKTEDKDLGRDKMKKNFGYSLNSENRKLRTSLMDSNNSKLKLINKNNINNDNNKNNEKVYFSQFDYSAAKTFCEFYFKYFIDREIFFASFYNKEDILPAFIRIPTFILAMSFLFLMNCFLLTTKYIHKRYIYAQKHNKINNFKYLFTNEFGKSFCCALIGIIFKMLCIKLIYGLLFRISNQEYNNLDTQKKEEFKSKYRIKSLIYFAIVFVFIFLFGFFSINYIGTFPYTKIGILLGFILSFILSFFLCALLCLINVSIYQLGKKYNLSCFISFYNCLKIIY